MRTSERNSITGRRGGAGPQRFRHDMPHSMTPLTMSASASRVDALAWLVTQLDLGNDYRGISAARPVPFAHPLPDGCIEKPFLVALGGYQAAGMAGWQIVHGLGRGISVRSGKLEADRLRVRARDRTCRQVAWPHLPDSGSCISRASAALSGKW